MSQLMVISALQKRWQDRYKTVRHFIANELSPAGKTRSYQFKVQADFCIMLVVFCWSREIYQLDNML